MDKVRLVYDDQMEYHHVVTNKNYIVCNTVLWMRKNRNPKYEEVDNGPALKSYDLCPQCSKYVGFEVIAPWKSR